MSIDDTINKINSFDNTLKHHIIDIINGASLASLRLINFIVSTYKNADDNIDYPRDYKKHLKNNAVKTFSIFKRGNVEIIDVVISTIAGNIKVSTSLPQLNYFVWLVESKILEHILINIDDFCELYKMSKISANPEKHSAQHSPLSTMSSDADVMYF